MQTLKDIPSNYVPDRSYGLFIDNQWVDGESGETIDSVNPANGEFLTRIPNATAADVDRAVQAAHRAFDTWGKTTPAERAQALLKIADLLEAEAERFAVLETLDVGKPLRESRNVVSATHSPPSRLSGSSLRLPRTREQPGVHCGETNV